MSTPRWKAKEVKKQVWNNRFKKYDTVLSHFETECGKKFVYARYWNKDSYWDKNTQFYVMATNNEHRSVEYRYWIYPIPYEQAVHKDYPNHLAWLSCNKTFVTPK